MDKALTGSILLGFGVVSHILHQWANKVAFSSSLFTTVLVWGMILVGVILIACDLWNEFQHITEDLGRKSLTAIGLVLGILLILGILIFLGLRVPLF